MEQHLESWSDRLPESVAEILRSLYVDDLISGGHTVSKAKELKDDAISIFAYSGGTLTHPSWNATLKNNLQRARVLTPSSNWALPRWRGANYSDLVGTKLKTP